MAAAARLLARISRQGVASAAVAGAVRQRPDAAALLGASALAAADPCASIKVIPLLNQSARYTTSAFQRSGFSTSAPQQDDKEANKHADDGVSKSAGVSTEASGEDVPGINKTQEPDSEDLDLSKEDLVKLLLEKDESLKLKDQEVKDNLSRASSVVKESFSKIDTSNNSDEAVPLLKTLLEGVEMTEKQLGEVFKKFGVEKFDPLNEKFDPNRHYALFQIPDPSKPSGTVAAVVKVGYMLHDRVLRPAEVGVTEGGPVEEEPEEKSSKSE
ncbi:hypothetical protein PVAP13_6NG183300 [Panicum virgatum]|uniref:GrpE protein homolog n=1 Tax=Panicum virgatum TaxID=38727 RepID=A0A8T0QYB6_PANVG|nr:hypothetical protein PVAP13_6NG183300 [Panicum virgatum]